MTNSVFSAKRLRLPINEVSVAMTRFFIVLVMAATSQMASGETAQQTHAFNLFKRIVGVPPTPEQLTNMTDLLKRGKKDQAINVALESADFYDVRLSPWVKFWFNENDTNRVDLNDGVATVIGAIRDNIPFNEIFTSDILYVGDNSTQAANAPFPDASLENNDHYREIENRNAPLKDTLVRTTQSEYYGVDAANQEIAGLFTTRAFAAAYYVDGTNRAAFKYTMKNFLCKDMEDLHDTSVPTYRIRQDVTRAPAGEPENFVNTCQGCHNGMDALAGAFAYFDFEDGRLVYDKQSLINADPNHKYLTNAENFPMGYKTTDNSWVNLWTEGQNSSIGWKGPKEGEGVKEFGALISTTRQFASCMAEQVFELICLHEPKTSEEKTAVRNISYRFEAQGRYSVKQIFRDTAKYCVE